MPPHFLKLSQALKQWGVRAKPMSVLATMRLCCSDWVRWDRENCLTKVNDTDILPPVGQLVFAYDNSDLQGYKLYDKCAHLAFLATTGHQSKQQSTVGVLGPESDLMPKEELTLSRVQYGRIGGLTTRW